MKFISFIIPCFNSSKYMRKCIESILPLGEDVEILIIDDGSNKDNTLEIAKEYQKKHPNICKAIHKQNGGHGDAINVGIKHAKGLFVKVVDSDDWIGKNEGKKLLNKIIELEKKKAEVDLFVTNYIYEKIGTTKKKVMSYEFALPQNKVFTWDDIRYFNHWTYMLMHSLTYRTEVLKKSKLILPKNTFYVDNIYAYKPYPYVKKLYYLNENLYHYIIGQSAQSIKTDIVISRLEQQYRVTRIMLYDVDIRNMECKKLRNYMVHYMYIIMSLTSTYSILSKDKKWLKEKDKLWDELKIKNIWLYRKLKYTIFGIFVSSKNCICKGITRLTYIIICKIYGFN